METNKQKLEAINKKLEEEAKKELPNAISKVYDEIKVIKKGGKKTKLCNQEIDVYSGYVQSKKGKGIVDTIKKMGKKLIEIHPYYQTYKWVEQVLEPDLKNYPNSASKTMELLGNLVVVSAEIVRTPINPMIEKLANYLSLGKIEEAKKELNYDKLFHLQLVLNVKDKKNNIKKVSIQKTERVQVDDRILYVNSDSEYLPINIGNRKFTPNMMLEKTRMRIGDYDFFGYHAFENNCQNFVLELLKTEDLVTKEISNFVYQDIESIAKKIPEISKKILKVVTDLGNSISKILGFGEGSNLNEELKKEYNDQKNEMAKYTKNKTKKITMNYDDFMKEHTRLISLLDEASKALEKKGGAEIAPKRSYETDKQFEARKKRVAEKEEKLSKLPIISIEQYFAPNTMAGKQMKASEPFRRMENIGSYLTQIAYYKDPDILDKLQKAKDTVNSNYNKALKIVKGLDDIFYKTPLASMVGVPGIIIALYSPLTEGLDDAINMTSLRDKIKAFEDNRKKFLEVEPKIKADYEKAKEDLEEWKIKTYDNYVKEQTARKSKTGGAEIGKTYPQRSYETDEQYAERLKAIEKDLAKKATSEILSFNDYWGESGKALSALKSFDIYQAMELAGSFLTQLAYYNDPEVIAQFKEAEKLANSDWKKAGKMMKQMMDAIVVPKRGRYGISLGKLLGVPGYVTVPYDVLDFIIDFDNLYDVSDLNTKIRRFQKQQCLFNESAPELRQNYENAKKAVEDFKKAEYDKYVAEMKRLKGGKKIKLEKGIKLGGLVSPQHPKYPQRSTETDAEYEARLKRVADSEAKKSKLPIVPYEQYFAPNTIAGKALKASKAMEAVEAAGSYLSQLAYYNDPVTVAKVKEAEDKLNSDWVQAGKIMKGIADFVFNYKLLRTPITIATLLRIPGSVKYAYKAVDYLIDFNEIYNMPDLRKKVQFFNRQRCLFNEQAPEFKNNYEVALKNLEEVKKATYDAYVKEQTARIENAKTGSGEGDDDNYDDMYNELLKIKSVLSKSGKGKKRSKKGGDGPKILTRIKFIRLFYNMFRNDCYKNNFVWNTQAGHRHPEWNFFYNQLNNNSNDVQKFMLENQFEHIHNRNNILDLFYIYIICDGLSTPTSGVNRQLFKGLYNRLLAKNIISPAYLVNSNICRDDIANFKNGLLENVSDQQKQRITEYLELLDNSQNINMIGLHERLFPNLPNYSKAPRKINLDDYKDDKAPRPKERASFEPTQVGEGKKSEDGYNLHAIVINKRLSKEEAMKEAEDISKKKKIFVRETKKSYRFRNIPKTKFEKKSFRTKKVNKNVSLIYGKLI